jgi:hypothetical protein
MMGFIERQDRSYLVATPGEQSLHHIAHQPFLMARANSAVARELGFVSLPGVVPAAFDTALIGTKPEDFVFKSLSNASLDVVSGSKEAVTNGTKQMAHMNRIAPGKRVRGNVEKWASSTVSLRGGRLDDSAGHPDAGKVWSFGSYRQSLTDVVNFSNHDGEPTTLRYTSAVAAQSYRVRPNERVELWAVSAATLAARGGDPTRLAHSQLIFDYLVDAQTVLAECAEATGRDTPDTEIPFVNGSSASLGVIASASRMPPVSEFCWPAEFLCELIFGDGKK